MDRWNDEMLTSIMVVEFQVSCINVDKKFDKNFFDNNSHRVKQTLSST